MCVPSKRNRYKSRAPQLRDVIKGRRTKEINEVITGSWRANEKTWVLEKSILKVSPLDADIVHKERDPHDLLELLSLESRQGQKEVRGIITRWQVSGLVLASSSS